MAENAKEDYFSSLHKRGTVSSRAKLGGDDKDTNKDKENEMPMSSSKQKEDEHRLSGGAKLADMTREFCEKLFIDGPAAIELQSAPNTRRSRSKIRRSKPVTDPCPSSGESSQASMPRRMPSHRRRSKSQGKAKTRPRSVSSRSAMVRRSNKTKQKHPQSDPVALYQYYQNEWAHFRGQIPGDSPHTDLRWNIRHKLLEPK